MMLIITHDPREPGASTRLHNALRELSAMQVSPSTWLLRGQHSASALMDVLEPLLADQQADGLFIGNLDALGELQWANTLCGDAELGTLIRVEREG